MRDARQYLAGLATLHRYSEPAEVRSIWRQGMAALAAVAADRQPVPLEGLSPVDLQASTSAALASGLLDDLDFLAAGSSAVALFELAAALPPSEVKRELGRRVLQVVHSADAETFAALATSLALTSPRALSGKQIRARAALVLQLPYGMGTRADALALALVSRRELVREWLSLPATGALPSRRLAARLIERAAREAVFLADDGDDSGLRVFDTAPVKGAWDLLFSDRESLVWRHIARARGLLSKYVDEHATGIEQALGPDRGPTDWRRAAASLAASIAVSPELAVSRCRGLLAGEIPHHDPGVAGAMAYGIAAAADSEREAVEALLETLVPVGGLDAAESLLELRRERNNADFGEQAARLAIDQLERAPATPDDGLAALRRLIAEELAGGEREEPSMAELLSRAMQAFASGGAELAACTDAILSRAESDLDELERTVEDRPADRRHAFAVLRGLDLGLLETSSVRAFFTIVKGTRGAARVDDIYSRMTAWLCARESNYLQASGGVPHLTLRLRRLKTLLHLIDAQVAGEGDDAKLRERRMSCASLLLRRVKDDADSPLRRTVCAALARVLDALVREELCELGDAFLAVSVHTVDAQDVQVLAEATMVPELRDMFRGYRSLIGARSQGRAARFARSTQDAPTAITELGKSLPLASSARVEALRRALRDVAYGVAALDRAESLAELAHTSDSAPLPRLANGCLWVAQLALGATRRVGVSEDHISPTADAQLFELAQVVNRVVDGGGENLGEKVAAVTEVLGSELPRVFAECVNTSISRMVGLAVGERSEVADELHEEFGEHKMAPWLPPTRTLGGFYVVRTIGRGAGGSVFVACRGDERNKSNAERFALKVPEYNGAAAAALSEQEFLRLFREEAGALLSLPEHTNLARFVTFDVGAKPKPILVMELVDGPSLERILERRDLSSKDAFAVLGGIARGLQAMHQAGVAHLDVKPSNIILRFEGTDDHRLALSGRDAAAPVLVDFGLAGRKIRPGCASAHFGAPEIWDPTTTASEQPMPADVYAFSCLAFEVLTGQSLFDGDTPLEVVTAHLSHDGMPDLLKELAGGRTEALAELLFRGLRHQPEHRCSIAELADGLERLSGRLSSAEWPVRP